MPPEQQEQQQQQRQTPPAARTREVNSFLVPNTPIDEEGLKAACEVTGDLGMLPDGLKVSPAQAMAVWRVVETVRQRGFPEALRK